MDKLFGVSLTSIMVGLLILMAGILGVIGWLALKRPPSVVPAVAPLRLVGTPWIPCARTQCGGWHQAISPSSASAVSVSPVGP